MLGCLEKLLPFSRSLQCLDLSCSNATTQYSLETISGTIAKSCCKLTELSVSNILVGPSNVKYVLSECKQLKRLILVNGIVEEELATLVVKKFDQQRNLRILCLEEANLDAAGTIAISSSLKHCTALTTLNLSGNMIGKEGSQALSSGFQYWPNLQELNLDGKALDRTTYCTNIGLDGAMVLAEKLQLCPRLSKLSLQYNGITDTVRLVLEKNCHAELHLHGNPVQNEWRPASNPEPSATTGDPESNAGLQCCIVL